MELSQKPLIADKLEKIYECRYELNIRLRATPLSTNQDGVVLVGGTRVTLDTVVNVFQQGATAEEIVYRYPALSLADVYGAIAYYLQHQASVEAYLLGRRQQAQALREENEQRSDMQNIRERLLARKRESTVC